MGRVKPIFPLHILHAKRGWVGPDSISNFVRTIIYFISPLNIHTSNTPLVPSKTSSYKASQKVCSLLLMSYETSHTACRDRRFHRAIRRPAPPQVGCTHCISFNTAACARSLEWTKHKTIHVYSLAVTQ